ncbi:hypothetical protein ACFQYP_34940 [Nonomuraea antimicrobica]
MNEHGGSTGESTVVLLDLRKGEPERLGGRMLVVAGTELLAGSQQVLQDVLSSRLVRSVLVVAVGPDLRLPRRSTARAAGCCGWATRAASCGTPTPARRRTGRGSAPRPS